MYVRSLVRAMQYISGLKECTSGPHVNVLQYCCARKHIRILTPMVFYALLVALSPGPLHRRKLNERLS